MNVIDVDEKISGSRSGKIKVDVRKKVNLAFGFLEECVTYVHNTQDF